MPRKKEIIKRTGFQKREDYRAPSQLAEKHGIDNILWGYDRSEEIAKYVEWHSNHPHCQTPRIPVSEEDYRSQGALMFDEDQPGHIYFQLKGELPVIDPVYTPTKLGVNGDTQEVAKLAYEREFNMWMDNFALEDKKDAWYELSVKDHFQDEHSPMKTSRFAPKVFKHTTEHELLNVPPETFIEALQSPLAQANMTKLAINEAKERYGKIQKVKRGPFEDHIEFTRHTKNGTALDPFMQKEIEKHVSQAISEYQEEERQGRIMKGSVEKDVYDIMSDKIGDVEKREKIAQSWIKYSDVVRKKTKKDYAVFDSATDLVDACTMVNVLKVRAFLLAGKSVHVKVEDDPLLYYMVNKAVHIDAVLGLTEVDSPDTDERQRVQKIIDELVKYGADINERSHAGLAPIHFAAIHGNAKMVRRLIDQGAKMSLKSKEGLSGLMYAAKYGHVYVMGEYLRAGGLKVLSDHDLDGRTPLHYCGMYGQTRAAMFLIRVGADKKIMDKNGASAGVLAAEAGFSGTAQEIFSFNRRPPRAGVVLDYLIEQHFPPERGVFGAFLDGLSAGLAAVGGAIMSAGHAMKDLFKGMIGRKATGNIRIEPEPEVTPASAGMKAMAGSFAVSLRGNGGTRHTKGADDVTAFEPIAD